MNQFFKFLIASILGVFISLLILIFIGIGMISSVGQKEKVTIKPNSILELRLNYPITERSANDGLGELELPGFPKMAGLGLNDILQNIEKAKTDENIKGIYLNISIVSAGFAQCKEIRNKLTEFKTAGKFVLAYSEVYTQKAYYLASVADKIYLNPAGMFEFVGLSANYTFYKNALDKLGIEPQIIKVGTFKSAVEPYILDKMSEPSKLQTREYLGDIYSQFLTDIGESRNLPSTQLHSYANNLEITGPGAAADKGLVDYLTYEDQVDDTLKIMSGVIGKLNLVKISKYNKVPAPIEKLEKNKIAVIYASGAIMSGSGENETIGSVTMVKAIKDAHEDDNVKAIVLRINSPGGSALASEVIWRELMLAKAKKPVIASMSSVAASGGYYIACAADYIIALPNTITGSIGVFGVIPNTKKFFNDKVGITFDGVKTADHADMISLTRPMTPEERAFMQTNVNHTYDIFTQRVADARGISQADVKLIGEGRVYSGSKALEINLVDELGGIKEAIVMAAKKAGIENFRIKELPVQKDALEEILSQLSQASIKAPLAKLIGEKATEELKTLKEFSQMSGIQARLPYSISIN
ncbi:MAG: protease-4 [Sphingobacteriales bacterium]|jgi:protease-4